MIFKQKIIRILIKIFDIFSYEKYLVLGDSHARVFRAPLFKYYYPLTLFDVCNVEGATVSGLENPNSKTNTLNLFREKLKYKEKYKKIIFLIGEVDTGFVIWYRVTKHKSSVEKMLQTAVDNYTKLLKEASLFNHLLIISAPLPTITDDNDWGEVANLRQEINATQLERTELTIQFNKEIELYCNSEGFDYLNLDKFSLNENKLVKKTLLSTNKGDHHYDVNSYSKLILDKIKNYL